MTTYLESLRRQAQSNDVAWKWVLYASLCFLIAICSLYQVRNLVPRDKDLPGVNPNPKPESTLMVLWFITLSVVLGALHVIIFCNVLDLRRHHWIRKVTPSPFVVALTCVVSSFIPAGCTALGILTDKKIDLYSLVCIVFFTVDFFCLQMAILPAYDYLVVHMCLSISSTIVLSLIGSSRVCSRILWLALAGIVTLIFLTYHHFFTTPCPVYVVKEYMYDMRVPRREGGVRPAIDTTDYPETARQFLRRWFSSYGDVFSLTIHSE